MTAADQFTNHKRDPRAATSCPHSEDMTMNDTNTTGIKQSAPRWWPYGFDPAAITDRNVVEALGAFSKRLTSIGDILLTAGDEGFADGTVTSLSELLQEHADQLNEFSLALFRQRVAKAAGGGA